MEYKKFPLPKPVGNSILVEVEADSKKSLKSSLIEIPQAIGDAYNKRVVNSTEVGKVLSIGSDAFIQIHAIEPYCVPGDVIMFLQNSGKLFKDEDSGKHYRIIREGDVLAVMGTIEE